MNSKKLFWILFFLLLSSFLIREAMAYQQWTEGGVGLHWDDSEIPVSYKINNGASSAERSAIQTSFDTWENVSTSSMAFSDGGLTSSTSYGDYDDQNIVGLSLDFGENEAGTIAVCSAWYYSDTGHVVDTDIKFNAKNFSWATDSSADKMDVQNIGTHEIGHISSLDDLYSGADSEKTMYGYGTEGETRKRSLHQDDIDGVSYIYPEGSPSPGPSPAPTLTKITLSDRTSGSQEYTDERTLNVAFSASNSPTEMILSENSSFSDAAWQSYSSSTTFTLSETLGSKTVYAKLRNANGESSSKSDTITYALPPELSSITLTDRTSSSQDYTDDRTINVALATSNSPTQMMLSENSNFSGAAWQTFASSTTFTLSETTGTKTVYAKVKNAVAESSTQSDSIIYVVAPVLNNLTLSDRTSGSQEYTNEKEVNVAITAEGNPTQICLAPYADLTGGSWQTYTTSLTYTLPEGDGAKTVYSRLKNASGVESNTLSDAINLDTLAPAIILKLGNLEPKAGDYITAKPEVEGIISESGTIDSSSILVKADGTSVSDGTAGGGRYDNYDASTKTVTYTFKNSLSEGSHSISIEVSDGAGNKGTASFANLKVANSLTTESLYNFPNPLKNETNFSYQLSKEAAVVIKIYSVRGELVKTLSAQAGANGGKVGFNKIAWDGRNEAGSLLPNGFYIYLITFTDSSGGRLVKKNKLAIVR